MILPLEIIQGKKFHHCCAQTLKPMTFDYYLILFWVENKDCVVNLSKLFIS